MESNHRLTHIYCLLSTALDDEEEYLYEGEMSSYARTYAGDARGDLRTLYRTSLPTGVELDLFVEAVSNPERIKRGRSKEFLLAMDEISIPVLDVLAASPDPQLRIFALETARASTMPLHNHPLYSFLGLKRPLLEDPDEGVRVSALLSAQQYIEVNAVWIKGLLRRGTADPVLDALSLVPARLEDPSPNVRQEAANALRRLAAAVGDETLESLLKYANHPAAREILASLRLPESSV